jgi:hypothetical protein
VVEQWLVGASTGEGARASTTISHHQPSFC